MYLTCFRGNSLTQKQNLFFLIKHQTAKRFQIRTKQHQCSQPARQTRFTLTQWKWFRCWSAPPVVFRCLAEGQTKSLYCQIRKRFAAAIKLTQADAALKLPLVRGCSSALFSNSAGADWSSCIPQAEKQQVFEELKAGKGLVFHLRKFS